MRLPFNLIVDRVFKLVDMMVSASSFELQSSLQDEIFLYLKQSGWTEEEFDKSLLDALDNGWTENLN